MARFVEWHQEGKAFLSTSAMRYAEEYRLLRARLGEVGELRLVTVTMGKSWERYGIHALEAVYPFLRAGGYRSVTHSGDGNASVMLLEHEDGVHVTLNVFSELKEGFGRVGVYGAEGTLSTEFEDTFGAFKRQLEAFIEYLRTGEASFAFSETVEQMKIIIAGLRSREQGGEPVLIANIKG